MSFESAALSPKSQQCYITVKKPNGIAGNPKRGLFSDEYVFEVSIAQLVSGGKWSSHLVLVFIVAQVL